MTKLFDFGDIGGKAMVEHMLNSLEPLQKIGVYFSYDKKSCSVLACLVDVENDQEIPVAFLMDKFYSLRDVFRQLIELKEKFDKEVKDERKTQEGQKKSEQGKIEKDG